jgi:putative peptidoglycan lipid II flippase
MDASTKSSEGKELFRATSIVSGFTFLSRVLGFIRDLLLARLLGAGFVADAFFVAYKIPNLLRSFVAEGALTSGFVPVFASELQKGKEAATQAFRSIAGLFFLVTLLLSILGVFYAPQIVRLFAPGFIGNSEQFNLCVTLLRIMFPYIIFVSFVSLLNGALNSLKIFGIAAFAQVAMNIVLIAGALLAGFFGLAEAAIVIAISVIAGGVVQVLVQIPSSRRAGMVLLPSTLIFTRVTYQVLRLMVPAIMGAAVYQISIFLNTLLATLLITGSVSWLFYADRVAQFPVGVFSIALASVLLPALSRLKAQGNREDFLSNIQAALAFTSFLIIPISFGLFFLAEPIVTVLFERGAFGPFSTAMTALAIQGLAVGLWAFGCHSVVVRAFLAQRDTLTPTLVGLATVTIGLCLSLILMGDPQSEELNKVALILVEFQNFLRAHLFGFNLSHVGLSISTSLTAFFSFLVLFLIMKFHLLKDLSLSRFVKATNKSILASLGMAAVLYSLRNTIESNLLLLFIGIPAGATVFFLLSFLLKSQEFKETSAQFRRLLS